CGSRAQRRPYRGASCLRRSTSISSWADVPCLIDHSHELIKVHRIADSPRPPGSYNHSKQKKGSRSNLLPTARTRETATERIELPPPYTLVRLRESGEAFSHALNIAGETGAGTLVYVGRFDLAEFAVVLEPTEPLHTARRAFYAGMVALGNALASSAPPDKPIEFVWPDAIDVDGGLVGGAQFAWADGAEDEPPQ